MFFVIESLLLLLSFLPSYSYVLLLYLSRLPFLLAQVQLSKFRAHLRFSFGRISLAASASSLGESISSTVKTSCTAERLLITDSYFRSLTTVPSLSNSRYATQFRKKSVILGVVQGFEDFLWSIFNSQLGLLTLNGPTKIRNVCLEALKGSLLICAALVVLPFAVLPQAILSLLLLLPIHGLYLAFHSFFLGMPGQRPKHPAGRRKKVIHDYLHAVREKASYTQNLFKVPPAYRGRPHLRLVEILPGQSFDRVECRMLTTLSAANTTTYEALSYAWGDTTLCEEISINGQRFMVTRNLHQALIYLRQKERSRVFWVDALCINQARDEDKSAQVQQMRDIYCSASRVIVWLGPSSFDIARVFESKGSILRDTTFLPALNNVLVKLLSTAWWTRIWVVQEVIEPKRVLLQSGEHTLKWEDLSELISKARGGSLGLAELYGVEGFDALQRQRVLRSVSRDPKNLSAIVFDFHHRRATDPRDKIFALLGLERYDGAHHDNLFPLVRIDYSKDPQLIAQEFIVSYILRHRSLASLIMAEGGRDSPSFLEKDTGEIICHPLWFGEPSTFIPEPFWKGDLGPKTARKQWQRPFSAAAGLSAEGRVEYDQAFYHDPIQVLILRGFVYDTVAAASFGSHSPPWYLNRWAFDAETIIAYLYSKLRWRTIFDEWHRFALQRTRTWLPRCDHAFHRTLTAGLWDSTPVSTEKPNYLDVRDEVCKGRRFFITRNHSSFGLGPEDVKPGDFVCILFGCDVPVILRQYSRIPQSRHRLEYPKYGSFVTYKYIGQAYVHNAMRYRGDLKRDIADGRLKLQDFRLRIHAVDLKGIEAYLSGSELPKENGSVYMNGHG